MLKSPEWTKDAVETKKQDGAHLMNNNIFITLGTTHLLIHQLQIELAFYLYTSLQLEPSIVHIELAYTHYCAKASE